MAIPFAMAAGALLSVLQGWMTIRRDQMLADATYRAQVQKMADEGRTDVTPEELKALREQSNQMANDLVSRLRKPYVPPEDEVVEEEPPKPPPEPVTPAPPVVAEDEGIPHRDDVVVDVGVGTDEGAIPHRDDIDPEPQPIVPRKQHT